MAKKTKKTTPRKQASVSKTPARGQKTSKKKAPKKWARTIKTDSTHPPPGLFTKDAETVAKTMATKKVSPGGIGSGIRMVQMYINRAGKNLAPAQKRELEKAKRLLQRRKKTAPKPKSQGRG
jgi:hypothetical protein